MAGNVACIGAGNVGRAWAIVFARSGYDVALYDANPSVVENQSLPAVAQSLKDLEQAGMIADAAAALARISAAATLEDAVAGAVHIQESVREDAAIKRDLFIRIDAVAGPDALIASSTSAIPGSDFMGDVPGRARCLVAHPVNPPYLIPLVEICPSPWTAPDAVDRCYDFMKSVGQEPIRVNKEIAGFILNRLQFTLASEALHLVGEGYCSVEDIDKVITAGLARRWAFIGPFEVGHLNATQGLRGYFDVLREAIARVQSSLRTDYPPDDRTVALAHDAMASRVPVETIPDRQAWRDRRLMALRKHLAEADGAIR